MVKEEFNITLECEIIILDQKYLGKRYFKRLETQH